VARLVGMPTWRAAVEETRPLCASGARSEESRLQSSSRRACRVGSWGSLVGAGVLLIIAQAGCFKSACASGAETHALGIQASIEAGSEQVPNGFVSMEVMGVLPTSDGNAVFLVDLEHERVLPIWIGPSEAMAIQLRMERRRFERPLTHDLLDTIVKELGGRVVRVHVDDLRGATFVATLFVRGPDGVMAIDARPSDAIAIAVGNRIPIYVSREVVERAGLGRDDLPERHFDVPSLEEPFPEGHQLRDREEPGIIGPPPTQSL
jgi:uncharacterized protein